MLNLNFVLLAGNPQGGGGMVQLVLMGGIILVFWLFMIRPQAKKAKEQKKFVDNMQKGDKVVTIAGIHGTINKINEDVTIQLEVSPGSYLKIEKSSISMEWTLAINKAALATDKKKADFFNLLPQIEQISTDLFSAYLFNLWQFSFITSAPKNVKMNIFRL